MIKVEKKYKPFKEISREKFLTPQEASLLSSMPKKSSLIGLRDYAIIKLMLNTGLRKAEVLNLKVGDFRHEGNQYWLMVHSKGGNYEEQDLCDYRTIDAILRYLAKNGHGNNENDYLFKPIKGLSGTKNEKMHRRSIDNLLEKYAIQAGIPKRVHAHMLRHTFAVEVQALSGDLQVTARAMRHRSYQSTMKYLHTTRDRVRANLKNLSI